MAALVSAVTWWEAVSLTSAAINTTGANLLVVSRVYYPGTMAIVTDSKSNTWTNLVDQVSGGELVHQLSYVQNPTVGTGHTFTLGGGAIAVAAVAMAFSGMLTSGVFEEQTANYTDGDVSLQPGSVTPAVNGSVIITGIGKPTQEYTVSIGSGFTIAGQAPHVPGVSFGVAAAYLIQTTAAAINPTWSWSVGSLHSPSTIAVFVPSAAAAAIDPGIIRGSTTLVIPPFLQRN